jgi:hypothetical protein
VEFRFCDERGEHGFSWVAAEPMARTSHALVSGGRAWLIDPLEWPEATDRLRSLAEPAAVLQLLDRHDRDCGALARSLRIPHLVVPKLVPDSPFECVAVVRRRFWHECALWWPETSTLVVADALGTNRFYTGGRAPLGVHIALRLVPPRALATRDPVHLLTGHGEGLHGPETGDELRTAIAESRRRLPGVLLRLPFSHRQAGSQDASTT